MKTAIISFSEISKHPTHVLSAKYWVNIKNGKLPFSKVKIEKPKEVEGEVEYKYVCSHTKNLNEALYLTEKEAEELNIAEAELKKAQELVAKLKEGK
jgi:hypothetical protein